MIQYKYKVVFFKNKNGTCTVEDFLDTLSKKIQTKSYKLLKVLEEMGEDLLGTFLKKLSYHRDLYQLEFRFQKNFIRIFCFRHENTFFCLHMISKKTNDTPPTEIKLALKRMAECKEELGL